MMMVRWTVRSTSATSLGQERSPGHHSLLLGHSAHTCRDVQHLPGCSTVSFATLAWPLFNFKHLQCKALLGHSSTLAQMSNCKSCKSCFTRLMFYQQANVLPVQCTLGSLTLISAVYCMFSLLCTLTPRSVLTCSAQNWCHNVRNIVLVCRAHLSLLCHCNS